jgi:hypothetical protein
MDIRGRKMARYIRTKDLLHGWKIQGQEGASVIG